MLTGTPSRTAFGAARHRAAHQLLEHGRIFCDPLALRILGEKAEDVIRDAEDHPLKSRVRIFIAARHRFTEDAIAAAVHRGLRQVVVLGAGLDTYAYRTPFADRLRIFEVDHPDTQAWKRECLAQAGIVAPQGLTFVGVNFETQKLSERLAAAGVNPGEQTFFVWLGVVPYLTDAALWSTLGFIATFSRGSQVTFDYSEPFDALPPESRAYAEQRAAQVARLGEPWLNFFDPKQLHEKLRAHGITEIEDLGPRQIMARFFPERESMVPNRGGHVIRATTSGKITGDTKTD